MALMLGQFYVNINGTRVATEKGASLKPGGPIKKAVIASHGFCGHQVEDNKPAEAKFSVLMDEKTTVVDLQELAGVTLVFEGDDGQSYLIRNATTEGEVDVKDGKAEVTMTGAPAEVV